MEHLPDGAKELVTDLFCIPCSEDNKQSVSVCFCTSCIEYLCESCYENHKRFKLLRNHKILKGTDMPKDISHFVKMSAFGYCKLHPGRDIDYKCVNHSVYICLSCVTVGHRNCNSLECIDTMEYNKEDMKEQYSDRMSKLQCKINDITAQKLKHAVQIRTHRNKILSNKDTFVDAKDKVVQFSQPHAIRIRNNVEIIILERTQFKVFSMDGRLKGFYKFNLQHLANMTFDSENNIYVCDKITKKIIQVEANNFKKNRVLTSLTECPASVMFNPNDKTFIVGFEGNDSMNVYKFV